MLRFSWVFRNAARTVRAVSLSRAKLEQLADPLVQRTVGPCRNCLKDAGLTEVDEVVLVGGQTRMPRLQAQAQELFGKEPHKGVNPDEVVGVGAAIQGGVLGGEVKDILTFGPVCVAQEYQRMGYGKRLMEYSFARAVELGNALATL